MKIIGLKLVILTSDDSFEALAHKGSLRLMNIQQDGSSDFIRESVMQQTASFYDIYPHIWRHDSLMDYG